MQAIKKAVYQNSLPNLLRGLSLHKQPLTTSEHKNAPEFGAKKNYSKSKQFLKRPFKLTLT